MPSTAENNPDPESSEHDIDGHVVRIVQGPEHEELWIDGTRRRFFKNSGGYVLADYAYVDARETLLEAVRDYLSQAGRPGGGAKPAEDPGEKRGER